jgi:hypothetical protein
VLSLLRRGLFWEEFLGLGLVEWRVRRNLLKRALAGFGRVGRVGWLLDVLLGALRSASEAHCGGQGSPCALSVLVSIGLAMCC